MLSVSGRDNTERNKGSFVQFDSIAPLKARTTEVAPPNEYSAEQVIEGQIKEERRK